MSLAQSDTRSKASTLERGFAPAKINLTLHVTGQRSDGYHLLDSLVVFAGMGDRITAVTADKLTLSVTGPFAQGVPVDDSNLVLRSAHALQQARGVSAGAALRLTKALPHAAGIGGGSSDAAATLRLLAELWQVDPLSADDPAVLALGSDVPVCMTAPRPMRMAGIGDHLAGLPALPAAGLVLVNPRVEVPTGDVFKSLTRRENLPMDPLPRDLSYDSFAEWLGAQRNDLQSAAIGIAPQIGEALAHLRRTKGVSAAVMSGSGATCIGLVRDMGTARAVAKSVQVAHMGWWVAPAPLLG